MGNLLGGGIFHRGNVQRNLPRGKVPAEMSRVCLREIFQEASNGNVQVNFLNGNVWGLVEIWEIFRGGGIVRGKCDTGHRVNTHTLTDRRRQRQLLNG